MFTGDLFSDNAKHCAKHPSVGFPASPVTRQLPLNLKPARDKVKKVMKMKNGGGSPRNGVSGTFSPRFTKVQWVSGGFCYRGSSHTHQVPVTTSHTFQPSNLLNSYFFATVSLDLRTASLAMSSSANSLVPVFSVPPMLLTRMDVSEEEKTGKRVRGGSHCLELLVKIASQLYCTYQHHLEHINCTYHNTHKHKHNKNIIHTNINKNF